ncbi:MULTISPECIES: hypothetical protein [unclassified Pantoea]|uniref:hypothetical protein n=1 Tax=unclassified Pantoea TaxID=2630326 RepID=UPI001231E648|nr:MULTISPECIES: hypothetical protein [unclassified Pantoea]KAA5979588.1 hypothetical protein F3I52_06530 [Pantoea sp. M_8]KAA5991630.1 hypothetical protein F3I47_07085 [Pantoea sp. M_10]
MQISAQNAIDFGFVCDRYNQKLTKDYSNKSSVDLTIRDVLIKDDKNKVNTLRQAILKPQDSAFVISEEILHVPEGFVAYVFLKNTLSKKGFLALNTGIIDSNYNGPISTLLINFSAVEEYLPITDNDEDKSFFRVVFHEIDKDTSYYPAPTSSNIYDVKERYEKYKSYCASDIAKFPKTFLEPVVLKEEIQKELTNKLSSISITRIGIVIALVGLLMSVISIGRDVYFANHYDLDDYKEYKIKSEEKINRLEEQINALQIKVDVNKKH